MARVIVVRANRSKPLIVTLDHLRRKCSLSFGDLRLAWKPGQASALDSSVIAKGRDVGTISVTATASDGAVNIVPFDITFAFVAHAFEKDVPITGQ